ncbi:hypothetical protein D9756_000742 [Leucocoprinus leucothites]|uniref:Uncharacterized protein n=1 Tax=Leucocoprinus leucothites TaxID=201217 RepID=A0A8H5GET8_9AGAR|nr:hypothetical protein D9756_000742 [Leucoagaricus leucothites]
MTHALNPYAGHSRSQQPASNYLDSFQQNAVGVQNYIPHRSELELAIPENQHSPVETPQMQMVPRPMRGPSAPVGHPIHELIRALYATREAQERENQRRRDWERQHEVSLRQRQSEMERQMNELRQQITTLQAALAQNNSLAGQTSSPALSLNAVGISPSCSPNMDNSHPTTGLFTPQYSLSPAVLPSQPHQPNQPVSPVSPVLQSTPVYGNAHFVQGSSTTPHTSMTQRLYDGGVGDGYQSHQATLQMQHNSPHLRQLPSQQYQDIQSQSAPVHQNYQPSQQASTDTFPPSTSSLSPPRSVTPSPSPLVGSTEISQSPRSPRSPYLSHATSRSSRKRSNADLSSSSSDSASDSSEPNPRYRIRRTNHHDRRFLTIHHAMRAHFLRMMQIETDKELPDSHAEGEALGPDDPIRFVWDKTTKQSVHNSRMKTRIMNDIKENSKLYKHVPRKDFNKKILDATFEQCFVTFRQKFRAQRDALSAQNLKKREDAKARRARRVSRRKIKLANRADAREKIEVLHHVTFDGALQVECMSSEESDYETDGSGSRASILRTRGYAWRSRRLIRFYGILDESMPNKIKRGAGKKERACGPVKEGFSLPPKRVASWMISQRWMNAAQREHPDLPNVVSKLIEEPAGFEWSRLDILGEDSEAETEPRPSPHLPSSQIPQQLPAMQRPHSHHHPQPHQPTSFHMPQDMGLNYNPQSNLPIPQHYNADISSLGYVLPS